MGDRKGARDLGLRVMAPRAMARMQSIHDSCPTAAAYQGEMREMLGIEFPDSPGIDEGFILGGWIDIPPYRWNSDTLKYSNVTFEPRPGRQSRDLAGYMAEQMKAQRQPDGSDMPYQPDRSQHRSKGLDGSLDISLASGEYSEEYKDGRTKPP